MSLGRDSVCDGAVSLILVPQWLALMKPLVGFIGLPLLELGV